MSVDRKTVEIGGVSIGAGAPPVVIAGPCLLESESLALECAEAVREAGLASGMKTIFKASYDKANRSAISSARGPGLRKGLDILASVREASGLPVLSDSGCGMCRGL